MNNATPIETNDEGLRRFLDERNKALAELDLEYVKKKMAQRGGMSDDMALLVLHKSRYEVKSIAPELRLASGAWLRERGFNRLTGDPILPEGELPE